MTRKLSIITAIAGAALVFAVPAAWGDSWGADRQDEAARVSPDLADRAAAAKQNRLSAILDARERALSVNEAQLNPGPSGDAFARAVEAGQLDLSTFNNTFGRTVEAPAPTPGPVRDDRFRLDHTSVPVTVSAPSSGTEIEWPQVGVGLGIGILLALGLGLIMRVVHIRRFAH